MLIPSFFLFAVYACVNVWMPLFLRNMHYSVTQVGLLLSVFEIFGVIVPFYTGNIPVKSGKYGLFLCMSGFVLALIPIALFSIPLFGITALCLGIYAASVKGAIPVSDSFINILLAGKSDLYGRIRAVGSLGFVCANIVMQRFVHVDTISTLETVLWMSIPALIFSASILFIPGLLKPAAACHSSQAAGAEKKATQVSTAAPVAESGGKTVGGVFGQFSAHYWLVLSLIFLTVFGQIPFGRFFSMYVKEYLYSDSTGILWVIAALSEIPFMFFSSRFIRRWGSLRLILFAALITSVRNVLYVLFPSIWGAAAAQMCNSITFGLFHPAAVIFAAENARHAEQSVLSQLLYSVGAIGTASVIGSALGGFVIERFGYPVLYLSYAAFPLAGILLFAVFNKKTQKKR